MLSHVSFQVSQWIAAGCGEAFALISDPRRRTEWQSSLKSVDLLSKGEPQLGTRWTEVTWLGQRFEMEISAYEPVTRWAERGSGNKVKAEIDVRFEPSDSGTLLTVWVNVELQAAARLMGPAIRGLLPTLLRGDLRRAGEVCHVN